MEFFSLYNFVAALFIVLRQTDDVAARYYGLLGGTLLWAVLFILQGFGLYRMAQKRNLSKKWLAFLPFGNIWYIGKLAGECNVFGQKMKHIGLYTMIAQILTTLLCGVTIAAEIYLYATLGEPELLTNLGMPYWGVLSGFSATAYDFFDISAYIIPILQLVFEILLLILLMGLYKKYYPKNYMILGFLVLFMPLARFIVIFVLRNRTAIDYEAYMRARREAYMRQQQQYQNMYGNPYQNPYNRNPYANPYNPQGGYPNQNPETEDPFEEFSSGSSSEKSTESTENNDQSGGDEFFR